MTNSKKIICIINQKENGKRLDQALTNLSNDLSRTQIKNLIIKGNIKKNNIEFYDNSYKVKMGEKFIILLPIEDNYIKYLPQNIPIEIIFEDKDLIVLNKEAGIVVHPAPGNQKNTLVNALLYHTKNNLSKIQETSRPGIVHRLDKDTSGLLVVAKNNFTHNELSKQFKDHSIRRQYLALVWGLPLKSSIKGFIGRHKINRKKMSIVGETRGRYSETIIKLKSHFQICSLIECKLKTGRTHQVRVHMSSIGNPIVGDKIYGLKKIHHYEKNKKNKNKLLLLKNFTRQALHAKTIGFKHPRINKYMEFSSDLPKDFAYLLGNLSKY